MMNKIIIAALLFLPFFGAAQTKKQKTGTANKQLLQDAVTRGKVVYSSVCLTCHQADGSGVPNMNPPLIKTKWVLGSKEVLITQVIKGSKGKVVIDGDTFHNTMPPLANLTDQQIADVLTYIRNSFGNKASMVLPSQAKTVRSKVK
jgi:mono/diheme cytochrome c family protein